MRPPRLEPLFSRDDWMGTHSYLLPKAKITTRMSIGCTVALSRLGDSSRLGDFANPLQVELPSLVHSIAVLGDDESHRLVREREPRAAAFRFQAVLHMVDRRVRHGHGPANF